MQKQTEEMERDEKMSVSKEDKERAEMGKIVSSEKRLIPRLVLLANFLSKG